MARPLKPFVRSGGYYPSAKYTPLVYPGGYTTLNAKNGKPEPINTFLGKIVRFLAKRSLPMVKLEANFTPIQNLNGQEAPWPPGGGKNKYSTTAGEDAWINNAGGSHSNNDGELVITCSTSATSGVYGNGIQMSLVNNQSIAKTVSFDVKGSVSATIKVQAQSVEITTQYQRKSITIAANTVASLSIYGGGTANTIYIKNLAITGDGSTDYAPYSNICPISGHTGCDIFDKAEYDAQATPTVAISFGQTVYGGKLTVFEDGSGQVVATHTLHTFDGTEAIGHNGTLAYGGLQAYWVANPAKANGSPLAASDLLSNIFSTKVDVLNPFNMSGRTNNGNIYFNMPETVTTVPEAKDWLSANNVQVWYKLATPVTIPLTASQINTLVGENVVWVEGSSGDITVQAYGSPIT